jgi:NAD(P)H-flavin reductase
MKNKENPYVPFDATITSIQELNRFSKNYRLDSPEIRELYYEPGQFFEITVYGVGQSVIGATDSIYDEGFELAVLNTGGLVSSKLNQLEVGSTIGIRGPFGKPFPMDEFKGKNMLFICAGVGFWPVRSAIKHVLANRSDYGELRVIQGVREPSLFCYVEEVKGWMTRDDITVQQTVDGFSEGEQWDGEVGLITVLTDKLEVDNPEDWVVLCVGPPVAFKFIGRSLNSRGFNDDQIYVSLERKMKCGIGKCNNCLIDGSVYVCRDGAVFTLAEVKALPGGLD